MGVVIDVGATEEGRAAWLQVRLGWIAGTRHLQPEEFRIEDEAVSSSRSQSELETCSDSDDPGLVGIDVVSSDRAPLGKIVNVLVEPVTLSIMGLELSNGRVRDWAKGRSLVILELDDDLGDRDHRQIVLPEEIRKVGLPARNAFASAQDELLSGQAGVVPLPLVQPIDWNRIKKLSEEEIRKQMAQVVWERRGSPRDQGGPDALMDEVAPWASSLKKASDAGERDAFDDVALLPSDQVEAIRIFRVGGSPVQRGKPSGHPEAAGAAA